MTMQAPLREEEARLGVTHNGEYGDLPDTVAFDAPDSDIRGWVTEAVRTGGVPGIPADPRVDFHDYVIERFRANAGRPFNQIQVRPKVPFGYDGPC